MNSSATQFRCRRAALLGAGLVATLALAGCATSATSGETAAPAAGNVTLKVAVQPIADFAPIWLGVSKGIFSQQGVNVEIVPGTASSSSQIPLLSSGQADLAATTATAALQAASQNVSVRIVGGLTTFGDTAETDQSGLIVGKGSAIKSYSDLVGKTVAVSGLKSVTQAAIMAAVDKAGGDAKGVKFIQIPMPNIANTVSTGGADAGFVVDPFLGVAVSGGATVLSHPLADVAGGFPATSLVATKPFADKNGATLKKFTAALATAVTYSKDHPDEVIAATAAGAKVPAEKLKGSKNPVFDAIVDPASLAKESEMLRTYGVLDKPVDAASIIWKG